MISKQKLTVWFFCRAHISESLNARNATGKRNVFTCFFISYPLRKNSCWRNSTKTFLQESCLEHLLPLTALESFLLHIDNYCKYMNDTYTYVNSVYKNIATFGRYHLYDLIFEAWYIHELCNKIHNNSYNNILIYMHNDKTAIRTLWWKIT